MALRYGGRVSIRDDLRELFGPDDLDQMKIQQSSLNPVAKGVF